MEAWIWTLLRADVEFVALAGDVHQLAAIVSESGQSLGHDRSLMQRLLSQGYGNVTCLTVQNRMCPEILKYPNEQFYEGKLTCGPHAPATGSVEHVFVEGREEEDGTSFYNLAEVHAIQSLVSEMTDLASLVIICPYVAQCRRILALGMGVQTHTIDSFQGREEDTVIVSIVRDGTKGMGFWNDYRRVVVAFTRARKRFLVVRSCAFPV